MASPGQDSDWNRRTDSHMRASECPNWTSTHLHHTADHDTPACLDGETSTVLRKVSEQGIGIKRETHSRRTPDEYSAQILPYARARTHRYAPITRDDQRLRSLCVRVRKIFERKTAARRTATRRTAARRDGAFRGVSTNFLNKASHLTAFYA